MALTKDDKTGVVTKEENLEKMKIDKSLLDLKLRAF